MYLKLGQLAPNLLASETPKIVIRFPIDDGTATKETRAQALKTVPNGDGWLTTRKPKKVTKKKAAAKKPATKKTTKAKKTTASKKKAPTKTAKKQTTLASMVPNKQSALEVIELSDDDDWENAPMASLKRDAAESSDEEFEF